MKASVPELVKAGTKNSRERLERGLDDVVGVPATYLRHLQRSSQLAGKRFEKQGCVLATIATDPLTAFLGPSSVRTQGDVALWYHFR